MNGSSHPSVPGLKLGDLAESASENSSLSPVAGKHIIGLSCSSGSDDVNSTTAVMLPSAMRRASENKVSG